MSPCQATLIGALVTIGAKGGCSLSLDQGLEVLAHEFGNQLTGSAAAKQLRQLSGGRMGDGHGLILRFLATTC
jgi:hypothetical protein